MLFTILISYDLYIQISFYYQVKYLFILKQFFLSFVHISIFSDSVTCRSAWRAPWRSTCASASSTRRAMPWTVPAAVPWALAAAPSWVPLPHCWTAVSVLWVAVAWVLLRYWTAVLPFWTAVPPAYWTAAVAVPQVHLTLRTDKYQCRTDEWY